MLKGVPQSWSGLKWQQLCDVWNCKRRYGGNNDAARAAALLTLAMGSRFKVESSRLNEATGEQMYLLSAPQSPTYTVTARELAWLAHETLTWFDYPYGDPGKPAEKDEKGKVIREAVEPHHGYVNPIGEWRDAMMLPEEAIIIDGNLFALPQVAMSNLTWHQYRALQALVPQLFREDISEQQLAELQAQFLAYSIVPEEVQGSGFKVQGNDDDLHAIPTQPTDPFAPKHRFRYNAERADTSVAFWQEYLQRPDALPLFQVCFQVYQTAVAFYSQVYHELFSGSGKNDPLHTALTGEASTLNAVMKYAGYGDQQQVYDSNLPFVLDILNTMTKEARKIEEMNAKARRKK